MVIMFRVYNVQFRHKETLSLNNKVCSFKTLRIYSLQTYILVLSNKELKSKF